MGSSRADIVDCQGGAASFTARSMAIGDIFSMTVLNMATAEAILN